MQVGSSLGGWVVSLMRRRFGLMGCLALGVVVPAWTTGREGAGTPTRGGGPAADLSPELTGGKGVFMSGAVKVDLAGTGYVEHEYVGSGTARSYKADGALAGDGRWAFRPDDQAAYRTRVLVRRPADPKRFSGTVVVEWLNVSGGADVDPMWASTHEEILRSGDTWVGISAQVIGVMGGQSVLGASAGLEGTDPDRYGSLHHPGDGYSFDIFTQVARALRSGGPALGGLKPQRLIAVGQSQSAHAMVTYINGVQPLTHEFDGFLLQSRGSGGLPLAAPGQPATLNGPTADTPAILRTDTDVPVLDVQAEGDLTQILKSLPARQPDSSRFRLWEVAGTAHGTAHDLGPYTNAINCGVPLNNGPMHIVAKAALHALVRWVSMGTPPPVAPRIDVTSGPSPQVVRDADGIAKGGVRTPPVDIPVDVLSSTPGPIPSPVCGLFGSTVPLPPARIAALYPSRPIYLQRYTAAVDKTINAGFALEADRGALLAYLEPSRIQ